MLKVISVEIKKMVSKPGVFVLAVLLAIILVLGVFIYEPSEYDSGTRDLGQDLEEIYASFNGNGSSSGFKVESDQLISNSVAQIEKYTINGQSYDRYFEAQKQEVKTPFDAYMALQLLPEYAYSDADAAKCRQNLVSALSKLNDAVLSAVKLAETKTYAVLTSKSNLDNLASLCTDGAEFIKKQVQKDKIADTCKEFEDKYLTKIFACIDNFTYPVLKKDFVNSYTSPDAKSNLTKIKNDLADIQKDIETLHTEALATPNGYTIKQSNKMSELCNKYISTAHTYANLVNFELLTNAFSYLNTDKQISTMYLSDENEFNANTNLIRYKYLFEHNAAETEFAHPLTIGTTSNSTKNGYDYAYFILRLFSFVIIAYAIMAACHAIAGELKDGTMRYLAIRPVSRNKILFGKMLAIIIMSSIFAIFSTIIALIVGGVVYGLESATILTIFNGSVAFTLHPIGMILIYVLSMMIELVIYASIALLLSCLLKSDLLAVTLMLMLYLLNILIPAFVSNPTSWLAFYPFSHISLYALFGSSVYATSNSFLTAVLAAKVFTNTTLWLTLTVVLVIAIVVNIVSSQVFKKKEL